MDEKQPSPTAIALRKIRDEIIEECARVAESYPSSYFSQFQKRIAAAIRELKDKP